MGANQQSAHDVVGNVLGDVHAAMGGEVLGQGLGAVARRMLAPEARRMTPERTQILQESRDMGVQPRAGQVTEAPILGKVESMMNKIFGDPLMQRNSTALGKEMDRLATAAGPRVVQGRVTAGESIKEGIATTRKALGDWASGAITKIQSELIPAEQPNVIPTAQLKAAAKDILADLPHTQAQAPTPGTPAMPFIAAQPGTPGAAGRPILTPQDTLGAITQINQLPDNITLPQMQAITNKLYDAIGNDTIVQGITGRNARRLWSAATQGYDDIKDPELRAALSSFRDATAARSASSTTPSYGASPRTPRRPVLWTPRT